MNTCWLCKQAEVNKSGTTCALCNAVYTLVQGLSKLTKEELEAKIADTKRRLHVHEAVNVKFDSSLSEKARAALDTIKES